MSKEVFFSAKKFKCLDISQYDEVDFYIEITDDTKDEPLSFGLKKDEMERLYESLKEIFEDEEKEILVPISELRKIRIEMSKYRQELMVARYFFA